MLTLGEVPMTSFQPLPPKPTTYEPQLAFIAFQLASLIEAHLHSAELDDERWRRLARLWASHAFDNPDVIVEAERLLR